MNKNKLKSYASAARREFIQAVTDRAKALGLSKEKIESVELIGDVAIIAGRPFPKDVAERRKKLESQIKLKNFGQVMEEVAYTWFNRFIALRYMELHDYLGHGLRVLSNPSGADIPEILERATSVELPGLNIEKVAELRLDGDKDAELYKLLLVSQCNALHRVMPFLFEHVSDSSELLLPENLLQTSSPIRKLVNEIPEEDWSEIEIVGWLYQFYISEKKDQVIGKVVNSEDIPAATQLFTPNWIVKYMVQNTLGRKWLMTYPESSIRGKMEFYISPAEQKPEVQAQLNAITPTELNPEELTFMDPACGSGHILVEAYDLFKEIYLERGYRTKDIPRLILEKNLYGLDIDDRAAQLAQFSVLMKSRADDRRILDPKNPVKLNILPIQESKGMDVNDVASVLLRERVKELTPGGLQQQYLMQPKVAQGALSTVEKSEISKEELSDLLNLFKEAKTFGSLLTIQDKLKNSLSKFERLAAKTRTMDVLAQGMASRLVPLIEQATLLARHFDFVVANPPYMGIKGLNQQLKEYAKDNYFESKSDLFAMFMARGMTFSYPNGLIAFVTMQSWMFLSSFENLRNMIIENKTIDTMAHIGSRGFDSISGEIVSTTAFTFFNCHIKSFRSNYINLRDGKNEREKEAVITNKQSLRSISTTLVSDVFSVIPGKPMAYWLSDGMLAIFKKSKSLQSFGIRPATGFQTGDNGKFIRNWSEVSQAKLNIKWFPVNNGGPFRKWYGNFSSYVDWENNGQRISEHKSSVIRNSDLYFKEGATWNRVSGKVMNMRYLPKGFLFDQSGDSLFSDNIDIRYIMGFMNTNVSSLFMDVLSTPFNLTAGSIANFPYLKADNITTDIVRLASDCIELAKEDWDSFESSWDFKKSTLACDHSAHENLSTSYASLRKHLVDMAERSRASEIKNNELFINAFSLNGEISPDVHLSDITLTCNPYYRYGCSKSDEELETLLRADTMKELISYAIGCMMGRYSMDEPGLIYAHSGNQGFDHNRYKTFPADDDGIVPIMDEGWFPDDVTSRFVEFLKIAWSTETLEDNLKFVADSLDPKRGESPLETIRRHISTKFFKDHHLKVYKKRPIYWLFSSGKHKAFECLVYLHRYNEATLSRMRSAYVTPLQGKISARIEYLKKEVDAATSASTRKEFQKQHDIMLKKQQEMRKFDELLRHYADQRISLDLDDGVKVNYGKFGNLLAEVKSITGDSAE